MMPIIEGLDGVQKMSKSLGNAIGVNEPPFEMFGKLMQVSDDLMWRYWTLLTDLPQSEIDAMRDAGQCAGTLHPMEAKKAHGANDYGRLLIRRRGAARAGELVHAVPEGRRQRGYRARLVEQG